MALIIGSGYSFFMYKVDPYCLISNDLYKKKLPNNPLYNYNLIKHFDQVDYGFLGSSAVNYFPIENMYPGDSNLFSMGIESSNIFEHLAYGKVLASKNPKEITLFVTFYALNPSRGNQNYFNKFVITANNDMVDFAFQYFNYSAYKDAISYLQSVNNKNQSWQPEFKKNGLRTQNIYLLDPSYSFNSTLQSYLAYMSVDPRYYASYSFKNPNSIDNGINAIKEFKRELELKKIKLRLVSAPEYRQNLALIYYCGLQKTYEYFREQLASICPYYDLNLDTAYTSKSENFWDSHHVRIGQPIIANLLEGKFLVTAQTTKTGLSILRPTPAETKNLKLVLGSYKYWDGTLKKLAEDIHQTPPISL